MDPTTLRVLIVDDEPPARARLKRMLGEIGGVTVAGEAASAAEARRLVAATRPDLVLLDIQMPGEDGFALLESLDPRPAVVFVTAFDHHAESLERVRLELTRPEELSRRLGDLLAGLSRPSGPDHLDRFTVRIGARQLIVKAEDVWWFGAEDKLVFAATTGGRHYVNFTLDQLERRLDPRRFARVHRGAIANLDHAAVLRPAFAGTYRLQLDDPERTEIPVSRNRARALRGRLGA